MRKTSVLLLLTAFGLVAPLAPARVGAEPPPPASPRPLPVTTTAAKPAPPPAPASAAASKDAKDPRELLRQGLFEEEANRDQTKAAAAYAGVVEQFDAQRNYIATAMFRLAEIRVKQGNKAEGTALYQRLLKEFSDNEPLAKLGGERLAALGAPAPASSAANSANEAMAREQEESRKELASKLEADRREREFDIFREAEKQAQAGQIERAKSFYLDLLRFPENDPIVKLSYARLAALGVPTPATTAAAPKAGFALFGSSANATPTPDAPTKEEAEELARVRELVKNSPDLLNAPSENSGGATPLGFAAAAGWVQVSTFLLDHGAKPNGIDNGGEPLHAAAGNGHKRIVELLLAHGAEINAATPDGWTALHAACFNRRSEIVNLLLEKGANPNVAYKTALKDPKFGWGPGWKAAEGASSSPLFIALERQDNELLTKLFDAKADPNLPIYPRTGQNDTTSLLIHALRNGRAAAAEMLMKRGAKVEFVDGEGFSALHAAAIGAPSLVPMLLERGLAQTTVIKSQSGDYQGKTPLGCSIASSALWYGASNAPFEQRFAEYRRAWEALLARGADINAPGDTPMHTAVEHITSENGQTVVAWLLEHGANINATDKAGDTPLLEFCQSYKNGILNPESKQALAWLLDHGADPRLKNLRGEAPMDGMAEVARFELNRDVFFPRALPTLTKERAVTAFINFKDLPGRELQQIKPLAEYDAPPTMIQLIQRTLSIYSLYENMGIRVYRATDAGPAVEVARLTLRHGRQSLDASQPAPALHWGDAVVFESEDQQRQRIDPREAYNWIQEMLTAAGRNIGVLYGDHHLTTFRQAEPLLVKKPLTSGSDANEKAPPFGWSPWLQTMPSWTLSEMVLHLTEADPRARIDAIQIRRVVNAKTGETQTWNVDLRWIAAADGSNAKDAEPGAEGRPSKIKKSAVRLGEQDLLIIPQRPAGDAEALAARRQMIAVATPGRDVNATGREFNAPLFDRRRNELGGHTLGEAIMQAYLGKMAVPNPDLSKIVIHRLKGDNGEEEHLSVDLTVAMRELREKGGSYDEGRKSDVPLQWGDIVQIVSLPDTDPTKWKGFGAETQNYFNMALTRTIGFKVSEQSTDTLMPAFGSFAYQPVFPGTNYPGYVVSDSRTATRPFTLRALLDKNNIDPSNIVRATLRVGEQKREYGGAALAEIDPWINFDSAMQIQLLSP